MINMVTMDPPFAPPFFLSNPHVMTLLPRKWPRGQILHEVPQETRLFRIDQETQILTVCNWQTRRQHHPTLLLVHGLEGCSESHYMKGLAHKAWHAGMNVLRMNQRNCGGTEHLTPTLYNSGLSGDLRTILTELVNEDGLESIWVVGYSMGGNLTLRMAGELGHSLSALKGIGAICPNIHPAACVEALERPRNFIYHNFFLSSLKTRLVRKAKHFPGKFDLSPYPHIKTLSAFDDVYTAPFGGYKDAADYYERVGARHLIHDIQVPTLIIVAQDDPFIPYHTFNIAPLQNNSNIQLVAPNHGGHCGFFQKTVSTEDRFWAENRILDFIVETKD